MQCSHSNVISFLLMATHDNNLLTGTVLIKHTDTHVTM